MPRTVHPTDVPPVPVALKSATSTKSLDGGTAPNDVALAVLGALRRRLPWLTVSYTAAHGDLAAVLRNRTRSAHVQVVGAHLRGTEEQVRSGRHGAEAHAGCPVLVYGGPPPRRGPVLLAVDRDASRHDLTDDAFTVAALLGVPVRAVHAWTDASTDGAGPMAGGSPVDGDTLLAEVLAARSPMFDNVPVERQIVHHDDAAQALVQLSADASMLVMGARSAPHAGSEVLGSTTAAVLGRTRCPIVVFPRQQSSGEW